MNKHYVIFLNEYGPEIYFCGMFCDEPITGDDPEQALHFPTARRAYEVAKRLNLDYWRVGLR